MFNWVKTAILMAAITALWSRRESDDVASLRFGENSLERCGWQVVALVDDDLSVLRLHARVLAKDGFEVTTAAGGEEAGDGRLRHRAVGGHDVVARRVEQPRAPAIAREQQRAGGGFLPEQFG